MSSEASTPREMSFRERLHRDAEKRGYREPIPDHQTLLRILMDQIPFLGPILTHGKIHQVYADANADEKLRAECEHLLLLLELGIDSFIVASPIITELTHIAIVILSYMQRIKSSTKHLVTGTDPLLPLAEFLLRHPALRTMNQRVLRAPIPNVAQYVSDARSLLSDALRAIPEPNVVMKQWEKRYGTEEK